MSLSCLPQLISLKHCRFTSALQSLSHALLLNAQNPFTYLQFAETAYTAGDIPLALKMFLVVIDMNESDIPDASDSPPSGISIRAWWGTKLVCIDMIPLLFIYVLQLVRQTLGVKP